MPGYTHIYFDFFGTLVDCSKSHIGNSHEASHQMLSNSGCELSYEGYRVEWDATVEIFVQRANESLVEFSMGDGVSYIPRLEAMLVGLASRHQLVIVSSTSHEPMVIGLLEEAGIRNYFSNVITSVGYGRRKPCPTIYEHALSVTGGGPDRAVFVGDSFLQDYAGPRAVGLTALLIDPQATERVPDQHRLRSVLDLPERIAV